jgi:hypothetical protein
MKALKLFILLTYPAFCSGQFCTHIQEIGFIYNLGEATEITNICKVYEDNRELFFSFKNESSNYGISQITDLFNKEKISKKSVDYFIDQWRSNTIEYRRQRISRDSSYLEGLNCLKKNMERWTKELKLFLDENKDEITSCFTTDQISYLQMGVKDYRAFNMKKRQELLKEETLIFGTLGKNMIAYNQLSFDIIDIFMTSQYKFGLKINFPKNVLSFYNNNNKLDALFNSYRVIEEGMVSELMTEQCLKRTEVLRYYDDLTYEGRLNAIRVNMLLNFFK